MARILRTEEVELTSLEPYPGNARRGNVEVIKESLSKTGQYRSIIIQDSTRRIIAGNHTWLSARELGWDRISAQFVECDDAEARRIVLIDNKSNDGAGYDNAALATLLSDMEGELDGTGFVQSDLDKLLDSMRPKGIGDVDAAPVAPENPQTKPGDVWVLGAHRVVCGSALELGDLGILLTTDKARLVVTSPPYNQNLDSFKPSGMQKENPAWVERMASSYEDSLPESDYQEQQVALLNNISHVVTDDASFFYNHKIRYRDKQILPPTDWLMRYGEHKWRIRQEIIWDRQGSITLNARMFMPCDERIYWMTIGSEFLFNDTSAIKSYSTVWDIAPRVDVQVSAPYPVELPSRCIEACSSRGDIVLDPYMGSGTTLIACEQLGRAARGVEINPSYCDVIVKRWQDLTGNQAYIEGTGEVLVQNP